MARLDELWRAVDGPGRPPSLDSRRVKARVNAALDACPTERKVYMKQKWRVVLAAAAAAAAITSTAFAATANWDVLTAWFQGDTAPGQEYVDGTVRSVSDKDYTLTVESAAADERSVYMTVSITALSGEAKEFLHDERFKSIDTFGIQALPEAAPPEQTAGSSGPAMVGLTFSCSDLEAAGEDTRRFAIAVDNVPASADTLRLRCGYMEKGKAVEVPIVPAASVTVKIGASGQGALGFTPAEAVGDASLTVREITLSPFTCHVYGRCFAGHDVSPNLRFRMADGTVRTQAQMLHHIHGSFNSLTGQRDYHYRFNQVQDLTGIASIIVFDMEYPLDGSKPTPVEHDSTLDPFTLPRLEPLEEGQGYTIPVRALTEKLGGAYTWDAAGQTARCTYRGVSVVLTAGSATALVDGREVALHCAPAERDGVLAADCDVFRDAWGIDCCLQRESGQLLDGNQQEIIWHDWYVIP